MKPLCKVDFGDEEAGLLFFTSEDWTGLVDCNGHTLLSILTWCQESSTFQSIMTEFITESKTKCSFAVACPDLYVVTLGIRWNGKVGWCGMSCILTGRPVDWGICQIIYGNQNQSHLGWAAELIIERNLPLITPISDRKIGSGICPVTEGNQIQDGGCSSHLEWVAELII
jgi:hypothetical protein